MLRNHNLIMCPEGDGTGGGGSGGNNSGTNPPGGSGPSLTGGAANPGGGTNTQNPPPNDSGNPPPAGGNNASDWKASLSPELQQDPSLSTIKDVSTLAQNYLATKRMVGADKIAIPNKHSTDEDWRGVFTKLGLPEKLEDYKVSYDEKSLDKNVMGTFIGEAHKMGILPKQAEGLVQWFAKSSSDMRESMQKQLETERTTGFEQLKSEWGEKYNQNVQSAGQVIAKFASKEDMEYLNAKGLDKDPRLFAIFGKIGEQMFKEDGIDNGNGQGGTLLTPAQAQESINKILADNEHPYYQKSHPNHGPAVAEMARLFSMKNPIKKR